jgi:hypothetical protein
LEVGPTKPKRIEANHPGIELEAVWKGLEASTFYTVKVKSSSQLEHIQDSPWSEARLATRPSLPRLSVTSTSTDGFQVNIDQIENVQAIEYELSVNWEDEESIQRFDQILVGDPFISSYRMDIGDLEPNIQYFIRVKYMNLNGLYSYPEWAFTGTLTEPMPPVVGAIPSTRSVSVAWSAPVTVGQVLVQILEIDERDGTEGIVVSQTTETQTLLIENLMPGREYFVRAKCTENVDNVEYTSTQFSIPFAITTEFERMIGTESDIAKGTFYFKFSVNIAPNKLTIWKKIFFFLKKIDTFSADIQIKKFKSHRNVAYLIPDT